MENTIRGFSSSLTSISQFLHLLVVALAYKGTPQLDVKGKGSAR